jgi:hypothetical protein
MWPLALMALACTTSTTATFDQCELDLILDVAEAAPGDTVVAVGRPLTDDFDTVVRVGGATASIQDVERPQPGCSTCDACRVDERCTVCEVCAACSDACAACEETVTFTVPDLPEGDTQVSIVNAYGNSLPLPLQILPSAEGDGGR